MQNARSAYLFERYTRGQCTAEEYQEFIRLIEQTDDAALNQLLDSAYTGEAERVISDEASERILHNIYHHNAQRPVRRLIYWTSGIAATILALIVFSVFVKKAPTAPNLRQTVSVSSLNDHRMIHLTDGSTVTLNKNSYLTYAKNFNGKTREVTLVGEGYFDIKHDARKPFLVHAGALTITVLGTAFNVNTANKVSVTVTRGKVSVSDKQKLLGAITPGQQISFDSETHVSKKVLLDADKVVKWQATDIFFDNVTMKDAAQTLEGRFGKKIKFVNEATKKCVFSGAFTHGEDLTDILKVICAFNKADYEENGDTITIRGTGC